MKENNQIFNITRMPEHWLEEGVNPPNVVAKKIAKEIYLNLQAKYNLIPNRIAPSIEEGIFIYYKNQDNNRALIIEVYNNFEIAALVTDESGKGNFYSENIKDRNFATIVEKYKN